MARRKGWTVLSELFDVRDVWDLMFLMLAVSIAVGCLLSGCVPRLLPKLTSPALATTQTLTLRVEFDGTKMDASDLFVCGKLPAGADAHIACVDYGYFQREVAK